MCLELRGVERNHQRVATFYKYLFQQVWLYPTTNLELLAIIAIRL